MCGSSKGIVNEITLKKDLQKKLARAVARNSKSLTEAARQKSERSKQARADTPLFNRKIGHLATDLRRTIRNLQGGRSDQVYDGLENAGLPGLDGKSLDDLIKILEELLPTLQRLHKKALVEQKHRNTE